MENRIFQLRTDDLPQEWLNIAAVVPYELPLPVDATTGKVFGYEKLAGMYSTECARIELLAGSYGHDRFIPVPPDVLDEYAKYRPTPLFRAKGFEERIGYAGKIFFKREDLNPSGSHKPNTAIPQAYYAKQDGLERLVTDTGAGQWGAALAYGCHRLKVKCQVFMTRKSYVDKPYRTILMNMVGAEVIPSPSPTTEAGRPLYEANHDHTGSLGIGMAEAMEYATNHDGTRLALGCMSYYAALHQTVIGQELHKQLEQAGEEPDLLVACVGGGTNFTGFVAPFVETKLNGGSLELVAVESANIPVLTKGTYEYDFQDFSGLTPKVKMYTLGHEFIPPAIHSGGLRYHGKSPILSLLYHHGLIRASAIGQEEAFAAGRVFFESEGILPAPETNHAIAQTIREARQATQEGEKKTIVFCLSGTGYLDLQSYKEFLDNGNGA